MGLTYATSNRGACHLRSYTVASEMLGIPEKTDPLESTEGKAGLVKAFQDATAAVDSAADVCIFTTFAWSHGRISRPRWTRPVKATGAWRTHGGSGRAGIWNLEREFKP